MDINGTYCFHGSEEAVGDDLSAGGGGEEAEGLVLLSILSESALVDILEDFIETELSETLSGVADQSRSPAL